VVRDPAGSQADRHVVALLADAGIERSPRWAEDQRRAGLGPSPETPPEREKAHWVALTDLIGRGGSRRYAVTRLASMGFACDAVRDLLREDLDAELPALDAEGETGEDYEQVERIATAIDARAREGDPLWRGIRGNVRRTPSTVIREAAVTDETRGEYMWQSFLIDFVNAALDAGTVMEPEIMDSALGPPAQDAWPVIRDARGTLELARRLVEQLSVPVLVASILMARPAVEFLIEHQGVPADEDRLAAISFALGPFFLATLLRPSGALLCERLGLSQAAITQILFGEETTVA
jgi:hypothetical protein